MKKLLSVMLSLLLMFLPLMAGMAEGEPGLDPQADIEETETPVPAEGETLQEQPEEEPEEESADNQEEGPAYALIFVFRDLQEDEPEILFLKVGQKQRPDYAVTPADAKILWASADESIAIVNDSGEIEAVAAGEVLITATLPDESEAALTVIVMEAEPPHETEEPAPGDTEEPSPDPEPTPDGTEEPVPSEEPTPGATQETIPSEEPEGRTRKQGEDAAGSVKDRIDMQASLPDWALEALDLPLEEELPQLAANQLSAPTNLDWGTNYQAKFQLPANAVGYGVKIYRDGGLIGDFAGGSQSSSAKAYVVNITEFFNQSGTYQFGVYARGDGTNTLDSPIVFSTKKVYAKPASQLGSATELLWRGADGSGNQTLSFVMPTNASNDGYILRLYFYNPKTAAWEEQFYYEAHQGVGYVRVWEYFEPDDFFYQGQYAFTVQPISSQLNVKANGPESARSASITMGSGVDPNVDWNALYGFIFRLYSLVFGRAPDAQAATWLKGLAEGSETGASAVRGFFLSPEFLQRNVSDKDFVTLAYRACMNRNPNAGEVEFWTDYLSQGIGRPAILNEFVNSKEYGSVCTSFGINRGAMSLDPEDQNIFVTLFVQRLYTIILNRKPDSVGMRHWTNYLLNQGGNGKTTAREFAFSKEFINAGLSDDEFITRMYRALLNREPEPAGMQAWRNEIALNGREGIFNGFASSPEFEQLMVKYGVK